MIQAAVKDIRGTEVDPVQIKDYSGVFVCDPALDGSDCSAREVELDGLDGSNKVQYIVVVLKRNMGDAFKKGDVVRINPDKVLYIDRSIQLGCRPRTEDDFDLFIAYGAPFPRLRRPTEPIDWFMRAYPLEWASSKNNGYGRQLIQQDRFMFFTLSESLSLKSRSGNVNIAPGTPLQTSNDLFSGVRCSRIRGGVGGLKEVKVPLFPPKSPITDEEMEQKLDSDRFGRDFKNDIFVSVALGISAATFAIEALGPRPSGHRLFGAGVSSAVLAVAAYFARNLDLGLSLRPAELIAESNEFERMFGNCTKNTKAALPKEIILQPDNKALQEKYPECLKGVDFSDLEVLRQLARAEMNRVARETASELSGIFSTTHDPLKIIRKDRTFANITLGCSKDEAQTISKEIVTQVESKEIQGKHPCLQSMRLAWIDALRTRAFNEIQKTAKGKAGYSEGDALEAILDSPEMKRIEDEKTRREIAYHILARLPAEKIKARYPESLSEVNPAAITGLTNKALQIEENYAKTLEQEKKSVFSSAAN